MGNQSRPNRKLILVPLIICGVLILSAVLYFVISVAVANKERTSTTQHSTTQIINGVEWNVDYTVTEIISQNAVKDTKKEITKITASYTKLENSFDGADVRVKIIVSLVGTPLEEKNWFKIEKSEKICDRLDESVVYSDTFTRYEEKLEFDLTDVD